jgi:hypothetical protein
MKREEHYRADNSTVDDSGLWRKNKMADTHAKKANPAIDNGGLCKKKKMADTHAKGARDRGHGRGGPGLARDTRRADINAQEMVDTHTHTADSNRSNGAPRQESGAVLLYKEVEQSGSMQTQFWTWIRTRTRTRTRIQVHSNT